MKAILGLILFVTTSILVYAYIILEHGQSSDMQKTILQSEQSKRMRKVSCLLLSEHGNIETSKTKDGVKITITSDDPREVLRMHKMAEIKEMAEELQRL